MPQDLSGIIGSGVIRGPEKPSSTVRVLVICFILSFYSVSEAQILYHTFNHNIVFSLDE